MPGSDWVPLLGKLLGLGLVILYRHLQAVTPDSLQYLLHDLFEVTTYWELETERATAEPTEAGNWKMVLDIQARKVVNDFAGIETEMPSDDWIEIGVYDSAAAVMERTRHIRIVVTQTP